MSPRPDLLRDLSRGLARHQGRREEEEDEGFSRSDLDRRHARLRKSRLSQHRSRASWEPYVIRRRPSALRLVCVPCGQRFSGTNKTPRLCPFCASDDVVPEAS